MPTTPTYYVNWGMMTIPVKKYTAGRDKKFAFVRLHAGCAAQKVPVYARITRTETCSVCTAKVSSAADTVKGYALDKDRFAIVTAAELKALENEKSKAMEIKAFVPWAEIDPMWLADADFLGPVDQATAKSYTLLRQALIQTETAAIVQYTASGKDAAAVIRATPDALMVHQLYFWNEVRPFQQQNRVEIREIVLTKKELDLAVKLVAGERAAFSMKDTYDKYGERVAELIQSRVDKKTKPVIAASDTPPPPPGGDLLDQLEKSLKALEGKKASKKPRVA